MRRKIYLYISDRLADLDSQSIVLFNYAFEDLSNPTIVKNSYSQQITLKGTPANNAIFGHSFRLDRYIDTEGDIVGSGFNPSQKVPFTIYNDLNEILQYGYVKLDSVTRKGADVEYKVTLYGGLGSFLYALSYDEAGNKRTLADLDYLGTDNPDSELNFRITKEAVQEAWNVIDGEAEVPKWRVINFAPAYNGIPDSNFDANKAVVKVDSVGLPGTKTIDGVAYKTQDGYALVNLAKEQDEWAVKDLRSYFQRPVLSMSAFWNAIAKPENNGGYTVDKDVVDDFLRFGYTGLWMTLPMLPSLDAFNQSGGDLSLSLTSSGTTGREVATVNIVGEVPFGALVKSQIHFYLQVSSTSGLDALPIMASKQTGLNTYVNRAIIFAQLVAYDKYNSIVGGSQIKVLSSYKSKTPQDIATACGYTPMYKRPEAPYESEVTLLSNFKRVQKGVPVFQLNKQLSFDVSAYDVSYYNLYVDYCYVNIWTTNLHNAPNITNISFAPITYLPTLWETYDTTIPVSAHRVVGTSTEDSITASSNKAVRSGALITKGMLLSTSYTPAEYMLSFCKMFGLYMLYDPVDRKITIKTRNELFEDETIDLTQRIDKSKGITITPIPFDAKWYDMKLEGVGGAFYDEYKKVYGVDFGMKRLNTGFSFNSETKNLMESVVFKNAATILANSPYFNVIKSGGVLKPSPFIDKGNTYTLWNSAGENTEIEIPCPPTSATVEYYNEDNKGYDIREARKLELRDAENKPIDGENVLVYLEGWNTYTYFKLSDDLSIMDIVNEGKPCWTLTAGKRAGQRIPIFQRYFSGDDSPIIEQSLDFGPAREYSFPGALVGVDLSIYARAWKKYLTDRYNVNTKVMKCKVDLRGLQVNQALLRKFYWYENTLWVLNSIKNHSLTTYDLTECEFVQVQDKENYLNGQDY